MATQGRKQSHHSRRRRHRSHPRMRSGFLSRLLMMLAVVAAIVLSVAIFFQVKTVEVQGNSFYDSQAIISASGLGKGDNLLAVNKPAVAGRIKATLPYVEQVQIGRMLPDTIVLKVRESDAVFAVKADSGENWLMSFSGKILEQVSAEAAATHPAITGFVVTAPQPGAQATSENSENLSAALILLKELDGSGIAQKVSKLDVSKPYDIVLWYTDQYEIRLGGSDQMDYKVQYLFAVLEQLTQYQTGTIDLTFAEEKVARFIPW